MKTKVKVFGVLVFVAILKVSISHAQQQLDIDWDAIESTSKSTATLQLVENPMVRPSSPIHKNVWL